MQDIFDAAFDVPSPAPGVRADPSVLVLGFDNQQVFVDASVRRGGPGNFRFYRTPACLENLPFQSSDRGRSGEENRSPVICFNASIRACWPSAVTVVPLLQPRLHPADFGQLRFFDV